MESNDLEDAERFRRLFVEPLIETLKAQLEIEFDRIRAEILEMHDILPRVDKLEANQRTAFMVYGILSVAAGLSSGLIMQLIRKWLGL
jgi:hypothetical protein